MLDTYFGVYPGYYFTGDGALRDEDGYLRITGRVDDVLNVSGHRMGTAEVESALVLHPDIAEAAVVGYPHDIKGQGIYAYITPMSGIEDSDAAARGIGGFMRTGNWAHRKTRPDSVGARIAQNAIWQDNAANIA